MLLGVDVLEFGSVRSSYVGSRTTCFPGLLALFVWLFCFLLPRSAYEGSAAADDTGFECGLDAHIALFVKLDVRNRLKRHSLLPS